MSNESQGMSETDREIMLANAWAKAEQELAELRASTTADAHKIADFVVKTGEENAAYKSRAEKAEQECERLKQKYEGPRYSPMEPT